MGCKLKPQRHCLETRRKKNNSEVVASHDKKPLPEHRPSFPDLCFASLARGPALWRAGSFALPDANAHTASLFRKNPIRTETAPAGRLEKRLRLPADRAFIEQHRAAFDRLRPGAKIGRIRRGRDEGARPGGPTGETQRAPLGAG